MEFFADRGVYELDITEAEALNAAGGSVWPASDAAILLDIVEDRLVRNAGIDLSQFPAGSYRNRVVSERQRSIEALEGIKSILGPVVIGSEVESYLSETTQ